MLKKDVLSSIELVLPPNVVEACYTLKKDVETCFVAVNEESKTSSEISLFKEDDDSVRIKVTVSALVTPDEITPEDSIEHINQVKQEKLSAADIVLFEDIPAPPASSSQLTTPNDPDNPSKSEHNGADLAAAAYLSPSALTPLAKTQTAYPINIIGSPSTPGLHLSPKKPGSGKRGRPPKNSALAAAAAEVANRINEEKARLAASYETPAPGSAVEEGKEIFYLDQPVDSTPVPVTPRPRGRPRGSTKKPVNYYEDEDYDEENDVDQDDDDSDDATSRRHGKRRATRRSSRLQQSTPQQQQDEEEEESDVETPEQRLPRKKRPIENSGDGKRPCYADASHHGDGGDDVMDYDRSASAYQRPAPLDPAADEAKIRSLLRVHKSVPLKHKNVVNELMALAVRNKYGDEYDEQEAFALAGVTTATPGLGRGRKKRSYSREYKIQCGMCVTRVKDYGYLFRHVKKLHAHEKGAHAYLEEIKPRMKTHCPICHKMVSCNSNITSHIKQCHSADTTIGCPVCRRTYKTAISLRQHLRQCHQPDRERFACDRCDATFTEKRSLREHVNCTHETTMVFVCDTCGKAFLTSGRLRRHKYIHGDYRYLCRYCQKGFHLKDNMNKHIEIVHEKRQGRRFSCQLCGKSFAVKGNMLQHMRGVHMTQVQVSPRQANGGAAGAADPGAAEQEPQQQQQDYRCPVCGDVCSGRDGFMQHVTAAHAEIDVSTLVFDDDPVDDYDVMDDPEQQQAGEQTDAGFKMEDAAMVSLGAQQQRRTRADVTSQKITEALNIINQAENDAANNKDGGAVVIETVVEQVPGQLAVGDSMLVEQMSAAGPSAPAQPPHTVYMQAGDSLTQQQALPVISQGYIAIQPAATSAGQGIVIQPVSEHLPTSDQTDVTDMIASAAAEAGVKTDDV